jgi:hypothetical protein
MLPKKKVAADGTEAEGGVRISIPLLPTHAPTNPPQAFRWTLENERKVLSFPPHLCITH